MYQEAGRYSLPHLGGALGSWEEFRMHLGLEPHYRPCRVKRSPIVRSKLPWKGRGGQAKSKVAAKKLSLARDNCQCLMVYALPNAF